MYNFLLLISFKVYFGMLDALLVSGSEELPEEYKDRCQVDFLVILIPIPMLLFPFSSETLLWVFYRTYCAMTVTRRGRHPSTGSTINVSFVVHITPR